jgi:hypothetical protein
MTEKEVRQFLRTTLSTPIRSEGQKKASERGSELWLSHHESFYRSK